MSTLSSPALPPPVPLKSRGILWTDCHAKRLECDQLAGAVVCWRWLESGSKLHALQTLRAVASGVAATRSPRLGGSPVRPPIGWPRLRPTPCPRTPPPTAAQAGCKREALGGSSGAPRVLFGCSFSSYLERP